MPEIYRYNVLGRFSTRETETTEYLNSLSKTIKIYSAVHK